MSNYDNVQKSNLGLKGSTPSPREGALKTSTAHVKNDEATGDLTLSWSDDRTKQDLKGERTKKYPADFDLE